MLNRSMFALAVIAGLGVTAVEAAPISSGNLVILRAGTGAAALSSATAAVFLDEYTTTGTLVQSLPVSASGADALTILGTGSTEGILTLSQDKSKLVYTGYRANSATASATATATNKVIGTLSLTLGAIDTSIAVTDAGAVNTRSASTVDGSTYYFSTSGAIRYVGAPGGAATSVVVDARNSRQVLVADNVVYASNGSTSVTAKVQSYGTLPTALTTPTAVATLASADAVHGFFFADLDAGIAGVDTLYALSTVESKLRKFTFDGSVWNQSGSIASTALDITGAVSGGSVSLYLTTGAKLQTVTDASGFNATMTGTISDVTTAGTNTAFRGLVYVAEVPEPASLALLGLGGLALVRRRK